MQKDDIIINNLKDKAMFFNFMNLLVKENYITYASILIKFKVSL